MQDVSKLIQSPNSIASYPIYSATFPNCVLAETQWHLTWNTLGQFRHVSRLKLKSILLKVFWDNTNLCVSRNSIASSWKRYMKFPKCVFAKIHLHLIESNPRLVQNVFKSKFNCTWSKLFHDMSKLIHSPNSIASYPI